MCARAHFGSTDVCLDSDGSRRERTSRRLPLRGVTGDRTDARGLLAVGVIEFCMGNIGSMIGRAATFGCNGGINALSSLPWRLLAARFHPPRTRTSLVRCHAALRARRSAAALRAGRRPCQDARRRNEHDAQCDVLLRRSHCTASGEGTWCLRDGEVARMRRAGRNGQVGMGRSVSRRDVHLWMHIVASTCDAHAWVVRGRRTM